MFEHNVAEHISFTTCSNNQVLEHFTATCLKSMLLKPMVSATFVLENVQHDLLLQHYDRIGCTTTGFTTCFKTMLLK